MPDLLQARIEALEALGQRSNNERGWLDNVMMRFTRITNSISGPPLIKCMVLCRQVALGSFRIMEGR